MDERLERLVHVVTSLGDGVLVAFSGGVDSALLLKVCVDVHGDRVLAATADSPSLPDHDRRDAIRLARELGVVHEMVRTLEMEDARYRQNDAERCYFCKHSLFEVLAPLAAERGLAVVVFGANLDDQGDFRPGHRAAREFAVRAPLLEAGLKKEDVRDLSRLLGLSIADKPASACLASRVAYGTAIDVETLGRIDQAESFLRSLGFRQCRVRHHGSVARIELPASDIARAAGRHRESIHRRLLELGYLYVAVDLIGYRSGSMNAVLDVMPRAGTTGARSDP